MVHCLVAEQRALAPSLSNDLLHLWNTIDLLFNSWELVVNSSRQPDCPLCHIDLYRNELKVLSRYSLAISVLLGKFFTCADVQTFKQ